MILRFMVNAIQPKINRATKYFMYITLNTRLIRSVPIQKAILDAYSHFLPPNRFPIVVLQIESDAQLVDVNVHPNKWEVRLSKQNDLLELVKNTIRDSLSNSLQTVQIKPKVKTPIFEQETLNFPYPIKNERKTESIIEKGFKKKEEYEKSYDYPIKTNPSIKEEKIEYPTELEVLTKPELQKEKSIEEIESVEKAVGYEFFYHLKVIGQLKESYILCENEDGLVIIDQHAAQERYHYEMLQETLNKPCNNLQPLMLPIQLDVSSNIMSQVNTINEKTSFFGLEFEPFGNDQLIVREIPLWFQDVHEEAFLYDLLDFLKKTMKLICPSLENMFWLQWPVIVQFDLIVLLTMDEMKQVIEDLKQCKQPYHCPHGRPTIITMSDHDLRKEFERG